MASTDEASASEQRWLSGSVQKDGARDLLSGMISGFFCKVLEYPFDTIKVLEQTGGAKFSGPLDAARKTVAESGVLSLYDGLAAPLIGSMAECASLFVAYGVIKSALGVDEEAATLEDNPNPNPNPNLHPTLTLVLIVSLTLTLTLTLTEQALPRRPRSSTTCPCGSTCSPAAAVAAAPRAC